MAKSMASGMAKAMALAADSEQGTGHGPPYGVCASFGRSISSAARTHAIEPAMTQYATNIAEITGYARQELRHWRYRWQELFGWSP